MEKKTGKWSLETAQKIAEVVVKRLQPYCKKIEAAGSIRRRKPWVNDIDICLVPSDPWNLEHEIRGLAQPFTPKLSGEKLKRFNYGDVQVDIYYASEETWAMLLFIRTGSESSNIKLASRAKSLGMKLKADGSGIIGKDGRLITVSSEREVFSILGLPYQEPWERG